MDFKRHPPKFDNSKSPRSQPISYQKGGMIKVLPFCELEAATNNFSEENILGRGSFGVVYKGQLPDGTYVAIKRLPKEKHSVEGELQFLTQVECLGKVSHPNLLQLYGFCTRPEERLLVYPFVAIGSLASRLKSQPPLSWPARRRIAQGVASALAYLHENCQPKVIHHLLKSTNVLLDEDFNVVVGDYGLVELMDYQDSHEHIYTVPDDYFTSGAKSCSVTTDVYAYGILLLELILGQKVHDIAELALKEKRNLLDWVKGFLENKELQGLVDSDMRGKYVYHEVEDLICVALQCIEGYPRMPEVVKMLENPDYWKTMKPKVDFSLTQEGSFSLSELEAATDNFSKENILGKGLYGSTVYKGGLADGSLVAVKRLVKNASKQELLFQSEFLVMRNITPHQNLLRLRGFCISENEKFLVYPLMTNGNIASKLSFDNRHLGAVLDWCTRKKIAVGVAKGLAHLHNNCRFRIIHGNLKAASILLDKDFEPVIGGFSCSQLEENENENENLVDFLNTATFDYLGTPQYIAPERFLTKKSTTMADVFAYGVLLYELITGEPAIKVQSRVDSDSNNKDTTILDEWASLNQARRYTKTDRWLIDVDISASGYVEEEGKELLKVASMCTQSSPAQRPTVLEIVRMLEGGGLARECDWEKLLDDDQSSHNQVGIADDSLQSDKSTPTIAYRWYGCLQRWEPIHLAQEKHKVETSDFVQQHAQT